MKAIILAAGKGSRLDPGSGEMVKCLLRLGEVTLLERTITYLRTSGIERIAVVVGFQAERVRQTGGPQIEYIENQNYAKTNSMYSLWLARHLFGEGFIVLNSDVLFHPQLLSDLLASPHEDAILISCRNSAQYGEEEMKVKVRERRLLDISKAMDPKEADGENVGIVKFGKTGAALLTKEMDALVARGELRSWAPRAFLEFTKKRTLHVIDTRGLPWTEIDFPEDYRRAQQEILPQIPAIVPLQSVVSDDEC